MPPLMAVGKPTPLIDGRTRVTGALRYAADLHMADLLHARLVTSAFAHANILHINADAALAVPGVVAVLTAHDLPDIEPTSRVRLLLARDRVVFAGQPVALVLATGEAAAEDGAERVEVDYDPLPVPTTVEDALAPNALLVWPDGIPGRSTNGAAPSNLVEHVTNTRGDISKGFAEAAVVAERTFTTPIVHQSYIEPHATVVQPDLLTGGVTVWSSTQAPFWVRDDVAAVLGVSESDVRVIGTPVGGGFGGKIVLYEPLLALVARVARRPVKLVLTRMEDIAGGTPAPASEIRLRLGAAADGTFTALEATITVDAGCYPNGVGGSSAFLIGSLYRVPNFVLDTTEVLTFKAASGAYRAPGGPPAAFALETIVDELACALHMDPFELRFKNAARPGDLTSEGKPWPTMGLHDVLTALQAHPAWQDRDAARQRGRGVGFAVTGWHPGAGPSAAACALDRDGTIHIQVGSADLSGTATSFALMAAEVLGVPVEKVHVKVNDNTSSAPFADGAVGSQTTYSVGPAVIEAAKEARRQVLAIASDEFEADPEDLEIVGGMVRVRGVPDRTIALRDIAAKTMQSGTKYAPIFAQGRHADPTQSPSFSAQLAEVEVDPETGIVHVHRLVIVQDVGRAINPLAVEGQLMGGATQGLGWALYERMVYDEQGQLITGSWMDYAVPAITQAAARYEIILVEVPSENGPFGARGVGEPPVITTAAAVANAIADATGIRLTELPMTAPRVFAAIASHSRP